MSGSCTAGTKRPAARYDRCGAGCTVAATGAFAVVRQQVERPGASSGADEERKAAGMTPKKHWEALFTGSAATRADRLKATLRRRSGPPPFGASSERPSWEPPWR